MASSKEEREARETEHFTFGSTAGPARTSVRKVHKEINNTFNPESDFEPSKVIDAFEQAKGFIKKPAYNPKDYEFKTVILDPENPRDELLLKDLFNNERYFVTYWKDTFTPQGTFRAFVIYGKKKDE